MFGKEAFFKKMEFLPFDKQAALFNTLSSANPFYASLDHTKRKIFLRQTGDNYRSFRLPTQQMSFSIINILALVSSPHGQLIQKLWRGGESRTNLKMHCTAMFAELRDLVQRGIQLKLPNGTEEEFNVVVFYVADPSHMEKVLGRTSCTSKYGCRRCTKSSSEWASVERHIDSDGEEGEPVNGQSTISPALGVPQLIKYGEEAFRYGIDIYLYLLWKGIAEKAGKTFAKPKKIDTKKMTVPVLSSHKFSHT